MKSSRNTRERSFLRFFMVTKNLYTAFTLAATLIASCLFLALPITPAWALSGYASVGGSWMVGAQSYFDVHVLGHSTTGFCLNRGAAEPWPGYYPFTAQVSTTGSNTTTDMWLEGASGDASYDEASGTAQSQTITFRAGTPNASWSLSVPAHCKLHTDGAAYDAETSVTLFPDQSFFLTTTTPFEASDDSGQTAGGGSASADASTTTTYHDIVITPPGAWDGYSYSNGLPLGYQRVGVGLITINHPNTACEWLGFSTRWLVTVRYFTDQETQPCATDKAIRGASYTPTAAAIRTATKPNCTPGLDAWYCDRLYHAPYHQEVLTNDLDLFGCNIATLSYFPATVSALQAETRVRKQMDDASPSLGLMDILPESRPAAWGTMLRLAKPSYTVFYLHDSERWRTIRRSPEGWFLSSTAIGNPVQTLSIKQDTTVYDNWTQSTYDGVVDW